VALLAAAVSHTPEGEEVLRGARMRIARKPSATARELLRNFPKSGKRRRKRGNGKRKPAKSTARTGAENGKGPAAEDAGTEVEELEINGSEAGNSEPEVDLAGPEGDDLAAGDADEEVPPVVDAGSDA
jgi:hypothetical protein